MNLSIESVINAKLKTVFEKLGLNAGFAVAKMSDRPDLSDLQCNGRFGFGQERTQKPARNRRADCRRAGAGQGFCQGFG